MKLTKIEPSENDLREIASLYQECFNAPDKGENWTQESAYQYLQDRIAEGSIFATLKDNNQNLIGVCCGSDYKTSFISKDLDYDFSRSFYISLVALPEHEQRKGHGKSMLQDYCNIIKQQGFEGIIVRCRTSNAPMRRVLSSTGFEEIHKYESNLGGVTCERVVLKKTLSTSN